MKDGTATMLPTTPARRPGRPAKANALTSAQRSKAYRERLIANGCTAVKCYLPPDAMAYLRALCDIHNVSLSEAVTLAVTAALRGEPLC
jgi:hypothetical protein